MEGGVPSAAGDRTRVGAGERVSMERDRSRSALSTTPLPSAAGSAVKLSMGNGGQRRKLLFSLVFLPTQTYFNRQCINFPQVCLLITVSSKTISLLLSQPIFHPVFSPCPGERGSEGAWVGVRLLARAVPPPLRRTFSQGSRFPRSPQNSARFRQYVLPHST